MPVCTSVLTHFSLFLVLFCGLHPFPTKLLMSHVPSIIHIILRIVSLCFSYGDFPASWKTHFILKRSAFWDCENHRSVANLSFIWKINITQIHSHLINNDIVNNFQSAYKACHSCETTLIRVYADIVTAISRGNGSMLVLLDLSTVFDTIDHDNLFCILEKDVGISGNALKLIRSHFFSNRTQRVQIDNVLSDFANINCSIYSSRLSFRTWKFCLYLWHLSAILMYHKIGNHVYADHTQLYIYNLIVNSHWRQFRN